MCKSCIVLSLHLAMSAWLQIKEAYMYMYPLNMLSLISLMLLPHDRVITEVLLSLKYNPL